MIWRNTKLQYSSNRKNLLNVIQSYICDMYIDRAFVLCRGSLFSCEVSRHQNCRWPQDLGVAPWCMMWRSSLCFLKLSEGLVEGQHPGIATKAPLFVVLGSAGTVAMRRRVGVAYSEAANIVFVFMCIKNVSAKLRLLNCWCFIRTSSSWPFRIAPCQYSEQGK